MILKIMDDLLILPGAVKNRNQFWWQRLSRSKIGKWLHLNITFAYVKKEFNGFASPAIFLCFDDLNFFRVAFVIVFEPRARLTTSARSRELSDVCFVYIFLAWRRLGVLSLFCRNLSVVNPILTPISFEQRLQGYLNTVNGSFWMAFKKLLLLVWLFGHLWDDFLFPAYVRVKVRFLCVLTPGVPPFCPLWGKPNLKKSL